MANGIKIALFTIVPLALILGVSYGLAKVQIIPTQNMGNQNPAMAGVLKSIGLYKTPAAKLAAADVKPTQSPEQLALQAQRDALDKERAAWEAQKEAQTKMAEKTKKEALAALPDPTAVARMAAIYEQMPSDNVVKIFAKLPDPQAVALMRRMEEKKVSEILAAITPERAAFFTQQLSHTPQEITASAAP